MLDLVGIHDKKRPHSVNYDHDSIQNVFSSTKAVTSIVIAMLVDRGCISYNTRIADIWSEFAQHGKDIITIEDLMRHESGLHKFPFSLTTEQLQRENLKCNKRNTVSSKIASVESTRTRQEPNTEPHRHYNFVTRGFIANEIVMRVDPQHRTIGEFIRDEIARPLNIENEFTLGDETTKNSHKIAPLLPNSVWWVVGQIFNIINRKVNFISCVYHLFMQNVSYKYLTIYTISHWLYYVSLAIICISANEYDIWT